jgi:antirestriction protein ArdC
LLTPGAIHQAYTRFHRYSLRNQLLALSQCERRGIMPGPLATFRQWQSLGRFVLRGEKALVLCVPIQPAAVGPTEETDADGVVRPDAGPRPLFVYRRRWFVLTQTDGEPYQRVELPAWNEAAALKALEVTRVPFTLGDGNTQGYSEARSVAINPVAALPQKTLFHELAHIILGHTSKQDRTRNVEELEAESVALLCLEALNLPGSEYCRGYVQAWATTEELNDTVASRIMTAADQILRAGQATSGT